MENPSNGEIVAMVTRLSEIGLPEAAEHVADAIATAIARIEIDIPDYSFDLQFQSQKRWCNRLREELAAILEDQNGEKVAEKIRIAREKLQGERDGEES